MRAGRASSIAISDAQRYHDVPMPARMYIALPAGRIFVRIAVWFWWPSGGGGKDGKVRDLEAYAMRGLQG